MGERPVFVEGEPPDLSLLQRLLCLEPEPWRPPPPPPSPGGAATTGPRRAGILEPPPWPRSPPSPPGEGLAFLQEAVRLLSPPEPPPAPPAALPELPGVSPVPTGSPDALSNLRCRCLAGGTGTDTGTGMGIEARTSTEIGTDNGTSTGIGIGTSTGTGIGTSTSTGIDTGTGIGTGAGTGTGSGRRRKQANPQRGADPRDPSFRGVTLRMRLEFPPGATGGSRLLITARGHRNPARSQGRSSSDDDAPIAKGHKRCASCKTHRTPLWRTVENGTVLCNACGIRYRKYRVRCRRCWNIPGKSRTPQCPQCPSRLAGTGGGSEDPTAAG